jgi:hypothetical protein
VYICIYMYLQRAYERVGGVCMVAHRYMYMYIYSYMCIYIVYMCVYMCARTHAHVVIVQHMHVHAHALCAPHAAAFLTGVLGAAHSRSCNGDWLCPV